MKTELMFRSLLMLFLGAVLQVHAEEKKDVLVKRIEKPRHIALDQNREEGPVEKVPVTFLGVETRPVGGTLTAQLGLPADIGLVVARVMPDSPASSLLREHDILTKIDDQLLIDTHQLSVLVRARKDGEVVPITLFRAGKEMTLKVKLGQREQPRDLGHEGMPPGREPGLGFFHEEIPGPGEIWTRQLPGMGPEDVHNVLRMIGRERHNWFGAPPVHFFRHEGEKGSTMLNLAEGNFVFSDDCGSVEVKAGEGKRDLTVKNPKGEITFQGSIDTMSDREKLPSEVKERLRKIENVELNDEPGEDFELETAVEPPAKTNISHTLNPNRMNQRPAPPPAF